MECRTIAVGLLAALALRALAAGQSVIVVDAAAGPGSDFTDIQSAVNAASDGDVVLVRAGHYAGTFPFFSIVIRIGDASLTIAAEAGAQVTYNGRIEVSNLSAGKRVVLRGLAGQGGTQEEALRLTDNVGPIWIEELDLKGGVLPVGSAPARPAAVVTNCASVTFLRCGLTGGTGGDFPHAGETAFAANASGVQLFDTACIGSSGTGALSPAYSAGPGGDGARIDGGTLFASSCVFDGGSGGSAPSPSPPWIFAAPGGAGLRLTGVEAAVLENSFLPGSGGSGGASGSAPDGLPVASTESTVTRLAPPARHFAATSPAREGEGVGLQFGGAAGETAFVLHGPVPSDAALLLELNGVLLVSLVAAASLRAGMLSPQGELAITVAAPSLPAGWEGATLHLQSVFFDPATFAAVLGPASALVILDSGL